MALAACSSTKATSAPPSSSSTSTGGSPTSAGAGNQASGQPVRIGWINIQGGPQTSLPGVTAGAQLAVSYANAELGGVAGRPVQLVTCYTDGTSAGSIACANKIVQSNVVGVLLGQDADPGDVAKIAIGAGLPYAVFTGNSTQELTLKGAFSFTGGTGAEIGAMAAYAQSKGYKNVAAITVNSPAAIAVTQDLGGLAFKNAGVGLKVIPVPDGTADMSPQIQAAISGGANALAIVGATTFCTAFFNAVASVAPQTPRIGVPSCATQNVIQTSPAAAINGLIVPLPFRLEDSSDPTVATYDRVVKQYSTSSNSSELASDPEAGSGYATVLAFVNIMKADLSGSDVTPAAVLSALSKANGIPLPLAPGLTLTCNGSVITALPDVCSAGVYMYKLSSSGKSQFVYQTNAGPLFATS